MKFIITSITYVDSLFGRYKTYDIVSLCGNFEKKAITGQVFRDKCVGEIVDTFYIHWADRLVRRLNKIGVDIQLKSNYPWIYLDSINGVKVKEIKNCEHGFCIGYNTSLKAIHRKDLFNKIRQTLDYEFMLGNQ